MLCKSLLPIVVEHVTSHTRPRHQVRPSRTPAPGLCEYPLDFRLWWLFERLRNAALGDRVG